MIKTTFPFSSLDGLTQDERDDLSSIVRDLNHLHANMDMKQTTGRGIVAEQLKLKERKGELMNLVVSWVQRPRPPQLRRSGPLRITPAVRAHSGFAGSGDRSNLEWRPTGMPRPFERRQRPWPKQSTQKMIVGEEIWGPGKVQPDIGMC